MKDLNLLDGTGSFLSAEYQGVRCRDEEYVQAKGLKLAERSLKSSRALSDEDMHQFLLLNGLPTFLKRDSLS